MMAEDGLEVLKDFDAIYFGAVGWPGVPDHISLWGRAGARTPPPQRVLGLAPG